MTTASLSLAALLLLAGGVARADDEERARAHFEAGRVQYNLGDYKAAVHEFAAGYRLVPRPEFLVNLGQAYRRLGELERAREMYERFLADAPPDDHARPQVRVLIAEVNRELARVRAAAAPPSPRESFARRHWWIFPVAGVVLVGVGVGIYFAARPTSSAPDCNGAELGCLPLK